MPVHTQSNDIIAIVANPLFQALLTSGQVSFDMDSGLIRIQDYPLIQKAELVGFRVQLQELHILIEQHAGSEARLKNISLQSILVFVDYKPLYTHGVLTLAEVLSLSLEHIQSLNRLQNVVDEGLDVEQKASNRMITREEQIAARIYDMLQKNIISKEDRFNFPFIAHLSPSLCSLIIKGKISLIQAQLLTDRQKVNFSGYNSYCLICADLLTVSQVVRFSCEKLFQLERLNLREIKADDVFNKNLRIAVQEEAIQYLKHTKPPELSRSFMFFNQTMMDMEQRHINKHVWHQIKERVATRMWDKYHFLFLSPSDPGFIERIDAGQDIKLAPSSEIQALLASSEGYRQYCRHTMFSSRFFRPIISVQEESSGHDIANSTDERALLRVQGCRLKELLD